MDSTDRGRDPEQPLLHRSRGLATDLRCSLCSHRRPGQRVPGRARQGWAVSKKVAQLELVSKRDFVAVQAVRATRPTKDGRVREYLCAGLLVCRMCGRRMGAHWVNGRPGYWCCHGYNSYRPRGSARVKSFHVREDRAPATLA